MPFIFFIIAGLLEAGWAIGLNKVFPAVPPPGCGCVDKQALRA